MNSINNKNLQLGSVRSVIRDTFEYANMRAKVVGKENVFDFSLGNPSIPTPACIDQTILELTRGDTTAVHSYTSAAGDIELRGAVAKNIKSRFGAEVEDVYITCGAAASLTISLNAICNEGDEVIAFAPYFPEYKVFAEGASAKFVIVDADTTDFQINFEALGHALNKNTKAIIINSPNNPSGAVISVEKLEKLAQILYEHNKKYNKTVYVIADEPYRELCYDGKTVPYVMNFYKNTIVCYSYSKSLSLPGERIGYIAVCKESHRAKDLFFAICGAGRSLGFVCAPSLMQKVIAKNIDAVCDIEIYKQNRDLLYNALCSYGYECVHPDGAFYLFVKSPIADANEFCKKARELDLMLVPSDSFGCSGYFRVSYCVKKEMIEKSLPLFKKMIEF